jgi:hypothetical protein
MKANIFSVQSAPLVVNGQTLNGGMSINYDLGGSVADATAQSFDFLKNNHATNTGFVGQAIVGGQDFFNAQVQPLTAGLNSMLFGGGGAPSTAGYGFMSGGSTSGGSPSIFAIFNNAIGTMQASSLSMAQGALTSINNIASMTNQTSQNNAKQGGGFCFITTAICEEENKPDNCSELIILRNFRDNFLSKLPYGKRDIDEYYLVAPGIVKGIRERADSAVVFSRLKTDYLLPALAEIKQGHFFKAHDIYKRMVYDAMQYRAS